MIRNWSDFKPKVSFWIEVEPWVCYMSFCFFLISKIYRRAPGSLGNSGPNLLVNPKTDPVSLRWSKSKPQLHRSTQNHKRLLYNGQACIQRHLRSSFGLELQSSMPNRYHQHTFSLRFTSLHILLSIKLYFAHQGPGKE